MEEAIIASIRPVIILLLLNEFFGVAERGVNNVMNNFSLFNVKLCNFICANGIIAITACDGSCDYFPPIKLQSIC